MTPCKIQRCSIAQKSVKEAPLAALVGERLDPLNMLPEHLHRYIFSFLLAKPVLPKYSGNLEMKQCPFEEFRDHHHNISLVSKAWREVVAALANEGAPFDILTPRELAKLKSKVFALNLEKPSIHTVFEKLIKMKWPEHLKDNEFGAYDIDPLATVLRHFGRDVFIKMVEDEYKRFLVLKRVEILASRKQLGDDTASQWLESVKPGPLVDLFWHAHVLDTKKYTEDCNTVFGDILEYSVSNKDEEESSSMSEKHCVLFQFEQSCFLKHNYTCDCRVPHQEKWASLVTRNALFGLDVNMEEMADLIDEHEHDGRELCPNDDVASRWFFCCGYCCVYCCAITNKFEDDHYDDY